MTSQVDASFAAVAERISRIAREPWAGGQWKVTDASMEVFKAMANSMEEDRFAASP